MLEGDSRSLKRKIAFGGKFIDCSENLKPHEFYRGIHDYFLTIMERNNYFEEKVVCRRLNPPPKLPSEEYPLERGEEVILECKFMDCIGHSFTNKPYPFRGKIREIISFIFGDESRKAVFISTLNAVLNKTGILNGTVHCWGNEPELCGEEMAKFITEKYGRVTVAHIGYQPGHVKLLVRKLGPENVLVTDLNPRNIGKIKFGVKILDASKNEEVISKCTVALITGSSAVNGTLPNLLSKCLKHRVKPVIYGVTGKGIAKILGIKVFCPFGH